MEKVQESCENYTEQTPHIASEFFCFSWSYLDLVTEVISFFLGLGVHLPMIKEALSQDKLNPTFVHGLLKCRDGLRRITAGGWDCIDQVS